MKYISARQIPVLWIVLALVGMSGAARAGAAYQGAAYQGAAYQGAAYQGAAYQGAAYQGAAYQGAAYQSSKPSDGWLEGAQLFGTIVLPQTKHSALIAATEFRGDVVVAVVWKLLVSKQWKALFVSGLGAVNLQPLHRACVRAAYADYRRDAGTSRRCHAVSGRVMDPRREARQDDEEASETVTGSAGTKESTATWIGSRARAPQDIFHDS